MPPTVWSLLIAVTEEERVEKEKENEHEDYTNEDQTEEGEEKGDVKDVEKVKREV